MDIDELKNYLKVDNDEDNDLIESLHVAAEEYMANIGISVAYEKKLYVLAIKMLVSHWYENRMIHSKKARAKLSFGLDSIILQLKLPTEI